MSLSRPGACAGALFLLVGAVTLPLSAGEPIFRSLEGTQRVLVDEPMPPASFPDVLMAFTIPAYATGDGLVNFLDCRGVQKRDGRVVGGNRIELDPEIIDLDSGNTLEDPPARSANFQPFALRSFGLGDFTDLFPSDQIPSLGILIEGEVVGNVPIDELRITCAGKNRRRCQRDNQTMCLAGNNRFQVEAEWSNGPAGGPAGVFRSGGIGGEFFFAFENFPELAVQILNGCKNNGHWWVFYAASTNVEYTLKVVDTQSGESRAYSNPLGQPSPAITDTAAFATCP